MIETAALLWINLIADIQDNIDSNIDKTMIELLNANTKEKRAYLEGRKEGLVYSYDLLTQTLLLMQEDLNQKIQ